MSLSIRSIVTKLAIGTVAAVALFGASPKSADAMTEYSTLWSYYGANHEFLGEEGMSCSGVVSYHLPGTVKYVIHSSGPCFHAQAPNTESCFEVSPGISTTGQSEAQYTPVPCDDVF